MRRKLLFLGALLAHAVQAVANDWGMGDANSKIAPPSMFRPVSTPAHEISTLAIFVPSHRHPALPIAIALVVGYALVGRVEFEVGSGVAPATQLVLVPMLFVLPLPWVPFCVAAGYLLRDPRRLRQMTLPRASLRSFRICRTS